MAADTVKALWVAGYHAEGPDKTELIPNETVVTIGRSEAEASDHWQVQEAAKPLGARKVDELKEIAAAEGIDLGDATKKADILERIEAHQAHLAAVAEAEAAAEPDGGDDDSASTEDDDPADGGEITDQGSDA